ncbi:MAG: DHH family phosphoesterase, partial [Candidatus Kariarchaeaceae archaeon]
RGRTNNLEKLSIHLGELAGKIASKFGGTGSGHLGAAGINIPGSFTWLEIRKILIYSHFFFKKVHIFEKFSRTS